MADIRLTEAGFEKAGDDPMMLFDECNEKITIVSQDGASRHENVDSLVTGEMILIPDSNTPIAPGDAILRKLPSGLVERLIVSDPGFYTRIHGILAHYQVKYRREGHKPDGSPGYTIHVSGENSRVNINSVDNSSNVVSFVSENLGELASEFEKLRIELVARAKEADHYIAIGAIASAENAAKAGDPSKVNEVLSSLGGAGKWVFEAAKETGVQIAAEVIKKCLGF